MTRNYSNTALDTSLTATITSGATALTVASATGWPSAPFAAVLDPGVIGTEEVVLVTAAVGTAWTVTRAYDGTTAAQHNAGATVRHAAIAADFTDTQAHIANTSNPHSVTAAQVGALTSATGDLRYPFVYNVKAYGATGDGATDDSTAIAAAITAAGAGGTVYFPPGSYGTNSSLAVLTGQTWVGAGAQISIIKQLGSFAGSNGLIYVNSANYAQIHDLGFVGNATNRAAAVVVNASADVLLLRLFSDATTTRLTIMQAASHRGRVIDCISTGTATSNAIEFNGSNYCIAESCTLLAAATNAVEIYQASTNPILSCSVVDCVIDGPLGTGVILFGAKRCNVSGNIIINCGSYAVFPTAGEVTASITSEATNIADNQIYHCGYTTNVSAITVNNGVDHKMTGNHVEDSKFAGISLQTASNIVSQNTCINNQESGIFLQNSGAANNVVVGNVCDRNGVVGSGRAGILVQGPNNTIVGNRCTDSHVSSGWTQQFGIYLSSANTNTVYGNSLGGNWGLQIFDTGTGNRLRDNISYVTNNSGTATITAAITSLAVSHGLATTPTRVFLSPTATWGSTTKWWISTLTSTQFTINVDIAPGSSLTFDWRAQIGEG